MHQALKSLVLLVLLSVETAWAAPDSQNTAAIDELSALAAKTSVPTPMTIVCLGDSITASTERQPVKYPEMLQRALSLKYGEQVKVINAGRGGDNVESALKRMETDVLAHKPGLIFVNLGINDSKLPAQFNYERNQIPLDRFIEAYGQIIALSKQAGAQVTAVGTIACVEEWTIRATQREKKSTWFGKGEELAKYNAAVRKLADEHGTRYVDLYDHFRSQPDLKALFSEPDGVHCRDRGQEQIALQLMRHLASRYPAVSN